MPILAPDAASKEGRLGLQPFAEYLGLPSQRAAQDTCIAMADWPVVLFEDKDRFPGNGRKADGVSLCVGRKGITFARAYPKLQISRSAEPSHFAFSTIKDAEG